MRKIVITIICFLSALFIISDTKATTLSERLKGRILLQVESAGEGWYVNPTDSKRYYLGRPADAFAIMRKLGLGIANKDLEKIPDSESFQKGDQGLINRLKGKILLQVESAGEAWYVNPTDSKRYYLGRPADAFAVMRKLGLGISNADIDKITRSEDGSSVMSSSKKDDEVVASLSDKDLDINLPDLDFTAPVFDDFDLGSLNLGADSYSSLAPDTFEIGGMYDIEIPSSL